MARLNRVSGHFGSTPYPLVLVGLLVFAAVLSGCIAENGLDPADGGKDPSGEAENSDKGNGFVMAPAHRFTEGDKVVLDIDESGAFGLHEYCFPLGCLIGGSQVRIDISDEVPVGIPAFLELEFEWDQEMTGGMSFWVETEDTKVFHYASTWDFNREEVVMTFLRTSASSNVVIVVSASFPGPPAESEWTLRGQVVADPERILPGIPVQITMDDTTTGLMMTTAEGEGDAEFLFWRGADEFIGHITTQNGALHLERPPDALPGHPVIVVLEGSPSIQINGTGDKPTAGTLQALPVAWEAVGDRHHPEYAGTSEWSFEIEDTPLAIGLAIYGEVYMNTFMEVEIASPKGTVLEASVICGLCLSATLGSEGGFGSWSSTPSPTHVPGTYEASVDMDLGADFELQAYVITFQR